MNLLEIIKTILIIWHLLGAAALPFFFCIFILSGRISREEEGRGRF